MTRRRSAGGSSPGEQGWDSSLCFPPPFCPCRSLTVPPGALPAEPRKSSFRKTWKGHEEGFFEKVNVCQIELLGQEPPEGGWLPPPRRSWKNILSFIAGFAFILFSLPLRKGVGRSFSLGPSKGLTVHPRVCHTLDGRNLWV